LKLVLFISIDVFGLQQLHISIDVISLQ